MREATHLPRPQVENKEMLTFISGTDLGSNSNLSLTSGKEIRQGLPHIFFQTLLYICLIFYFFLGLFCVFACFAVSLFLLDLRKMKFISLIKIMTLSRVLLFQCEYLLTVLSLLEFNGSSKKNGNGAWLNYAATPAVTALQILRFCLWKTMRIRHHPWHMLYLAQGRTPSWYFLWCKGL